MLKAIHAQESRRAAQVKVIAVVAEVKRLKIGKLAEWIAATAAETLAYISFPREHWRRILTNNPLERIIREIRRRTRIVGAFPDGESALNLAAAKLIHIAGSRRSMRSYLNMELLKEYRRHAAA
jgi:transposase-like protein